MDVLILCSESLVPLSMVRCYPIGMITMVDGGKKDEKIIAIPFTDPNYNCYKSIADLPGHIFEEMQHFFRVYKQLENKSTAVEEVHDLKETLDVIEESIVNYKTNLYDLLNRN